MLKTTERVVNRLIDEKLKSDNFYLVKYQTLYGLLISYKTQAQSSLSIALVAIFSIVVFQGSMLVKVIDIAGNVESLAPALSAAASSVAGIVVAWVGTYIFNMHKVQIDNCWKILSKIEDSYAPDLSSITEDIFLWNIYKPIKISLVLWALLFAFTLISWAVYIIFYFFPYG